MLVSIIFTCFTTFSNYFYMCCCVDITYSIHLRRRTSKYLTTIIIPHYLMTLICLCASFIPLSAPTPRLELLAVNELFINHLSSDLLQNSLWCSSSASPGPSFSPRPLSSAPCSGQTFWSSSSASSLTSSWSPLASMSAARKWVRKRSLSQEVWKLWTWFLLDPF